VAAVSIGTDAELTGLSPIKLASIFALLLVARSVAELERLRSALALRW